MRSRLLAPALLFALGLPAAAAELAEGSRFPDLVLPDARDGRPRSLSEFRGEKVVLHVFASW
ncbi:MAG: hypothetical protein GY716_05405 [bacterium]|nr:hypothetical protein [bacterium]